MALDYLSSADGFKIVSDDLTLESDIIQGNGAPPGSSGQTLVAPIGSVYHQLDADADLLNFWYKHTNVGASSDWSQSASKSYVDAAVQGISWREPALVLDTTTYANIAAAEAAANVGDTVDGITIVPGSRLLFTDLTTGNDNVYIVSGSTGAWTFTEDTNLATDGDAVLIQEGTNADTQWTYDGTDWIQFAGAGSAAELINIRNFIGKPTAGANFPQYQSVDIVALNDDLTTGVGKLDNSIGTLQFTTNNVLTDFLAAGFASTTDITANLDALDATYGAGTITNQLNYPITDDMIWGGGTLTLTDALNALNNIIGDTSYTNDFIVADADNLTESVNKIDTELGDLDNTSAWTTGGLLGTTALANNDIQENLDAFNVAIGDLNDDSIENTGSAPASTVTVIDTIPAASTTEVKWLVQVKRTSNGNRRAWEVHALTDGTALDFNRFSGLTVGGTTGNPGLDVVINAGNIELRLNPNNALDYTFKRITTSFLA